MAISTSLIAKGIAGTLSLAAPVATSVYYKDNIYEFFVPKKINQDLVSKPEDSSWNIEELETTKIKITYLKDKNCSINLTGNGASANRSEIIKKLKEKLGEKNASTENHKRYRRGILKKCETNNTFSVDIVESSENIDFSKLFDLSKEELIDSESQDLKDKTFTISSSVDESKLTITVTVNYDNSDDSSVKECKIIGSAKNEETITSTNLNNSKDEIKKSVEDKINPSGKDKESDRKKFLTKCKRSFDNEIKLFLVAKTGEANKYELENLSSIFAAS